MTIFAESAKLGSADVVICLICNAPIFDSEDARLAHEDYERSQAHKALRPVECPACA